MDTREEHDLLELLLEQTKPSCNTDKHFLIFTPFRYPPLKYGSRFGETYEPSLWYGSISIESAFAEVAYYRLKFFEDSSANLEYIETPMTAFKAHIKTKKGIDLSLPPFKKYEEQISNINSYEKSKLLGAEMRDAAVQAFIYTSARDKNSGKNVGAFTHQVFLKTNQGYVTRMQNWRCIANKDQIEFTRNDLIKNERYEFSKTGFNASRLLASDFIVA